MNADALRATFLYYDFRDPDADEAPAVPEPTSESEWADLHEMADENEDDLGVVRVTKGDIEIAIEDSLDAIIANLCLGSIPDLIGERHVVMRYFLSYGYLRLDPEGDNQLVSGDFVPTVRLPRSELIPALFELGERYVEFFERLRPPGGEYENLRVTLHEQLGRARAAMSAWSDS